MANQFPYDVFLNYHWKDESRVWELAEKLRTAGLQVAPERGLEQARAQVLCLSPAALGSEWVRLERSTVLFRDPSNASRRFVPLLLADCDIPDALRRYKYIDYRWKTREAFDELLAALRAEMESAPTVTEAKLEKTSPQPPKQTDPLAVLERELTGHNDKVNSLAASPDGTWVVSGSRDKTLKIWDLETGACRQSLKGHTDGVKSVAVTPDGRRILSASFDKSVRVWDARAGRELAKLGEHAREVWTVVALRDNARALSGGFDKALRLWDLATGTCLKVIECGTDSADDVFGTAVDPAGARALSGHRNGRVRLWDLETGQCLAVLKGHSNIVNSVQIMSDGRFAISGSDDKTVKVWDLDAGTCVGTLPGAASGVSLSIPAGEGHPLGTRCLCLLHF